MLKFGPLFKLLAALALLAGISACDSGGVGTSSNPDLTASNSGFVYSGPAARNIDVSNFQFYLWRNVNQDGRCGGCHNSRASTPESPLFFDTSNVNVAYDASIAYVDLGNPLNSEFVAKLNGGHNCWESVPSICGTLIAGWIEDWKNANNGGVASRQINLVPPGRIEDPGEAKSFPATATTTGPTGKSFANTVYPLLTGTSPVITDGNCQNCHEEIAKPLPQAPFFASADVDAAYEAAKAKMDIDNPINSRFVQRLIEQHNCWSDCASDWRDMRDVIAAFAGDILPTPIDPALVTSKALTLPEGIVASGGNRHETDQFAIWEFKTGTGLTAFDTSGLDPAINLAMIGSVNWVPGYGLEFTGGRAQADTINSDKLYTYIRDTGEYAIEAWVIPSNVSQQDTNIVSYSGGDTTRNFTLGQTLYNYESFNRIDTPSAGQANGEPMLTTGDSGMEIAQASLQHVVVNYDPFSGRSVYVNGQLVPGLTDPAGAPTSVSNDWDDGLAFVLGGEIGGSRSWAGQLKMVAMHNRALTPAQIQQNFDVGVGQKFYLMFYVGDHLSEDPADPKSFIMFEVAQFDGFSYLFNKPTFINLDPAWVPGSIAIRGLRIGINGKEALAGQAFANLDVTVDAGSYDPALGQELSPLGTVIALEKGATSDEFFLTFELFAAENNAFTEVQPSVPADPADPANPPASDIGLRTFDEINATIAAITGVPVTNNQVQSVYDDYIQQLPTVEDISSFLPSHQMAIAQLAMTSCSELVEGNGSISRAAYFPGFDFTAVETTAFDTPSKRGQVIDPLLTAAMNVNTANAADNLLTQPDQGEVDDLLGAAAPAPIEAGYPAYSSLIDEVLAAPCNAPFCVANSASRTRQVVKAVCAVATGGAVMLVQ
jgi:hypothetical protein